MQGKQMSYIYRNLTTGKWQFGDKPKAPWKRDGKPLRFTAVVARHVSFHLSESSRQRCLKNLQTNSKYGWDVHAYAVGTVIACTEQGDIADPVPGKPIAITYDKFNSGRFIRKDTGQPITYCQYVHFAADGHTYALGEVR
jgi:hypothetical protein